MALEPPAVPTSGFFADELGRALAECGFGILSWEVDAVASGAGSGELGAAQATAKVELVPDEDKQPETAMSKTVQKNIGVRLTIAGYQVSPLTPWPESGETQGAMFLSRMRKAQQSLIAWRPHLCLPCSFVPTGHCGGNGQPRNGRRLVDGKAIAQLRDAR